MEERVAEGEQQYCKQSKLCDFEISQDVFTGLGWQRRVQQLVNGPSHFQGYREIMMTSAYYCSENLEVLHAIRMTKERK